MPYSCPHGVWDSCRRRLAPTLRGAEDSHTMQHTAVAVSAMDHMSAFVSIGAVEHLDTTKGKLLASRRDRVITFSLHCPRIHSGTKKFRAH